MSKVKVCRYAGRAFPNTPRDTNVPSFLPCRTPETPKIAKRSGHSDSPNGRPNLRSAQERPRQADPSFLPSSSSRTPTANCPQIRSALQSWNGYPPRRTWTTTREPNKTGWAIPADGFWKGRSSRTGGRRDPRRCSGCMGSVSLPTLAIPNVRPIPRLYNRDI